MIFDAFLNIFFPPVCPVCSKKIKTNGCLCPECFSKLHFVVDNSNVQSSAIVYNEIGKQLILSFKYGDRLDLTPLLARLMYNSGLTVLDGADVLTCVPLHWKRMLIRKYNQSAVLAKELSGLSGIPSNPFLLKRVKSTPKQGTRKERFENVKNAFVLNSGFSVREKTVVLIDDVLTTGSTAQACSNLLRKGGAKEVRLLTFAKVSNDD